MNKLLLCFFTTVLSLMVSAQKVYFVYLQSENEQPFFVKMNERITSSNSLGYLILPKLKDSTYNFVVGFPRNQYPEQNFTVAIQGSDHGYLVKQFAEKGWVLFDLQTLSVQMAGASAASRLPATEKKEVSSFTDILARAADDPTLREKEIVKVEEKKPEPVKEVVKVEEKKPEPAKEVVKVEEKKPEPANEVAKVEHKEPEHPDPVLVVEPKKEETKPETIYKPSVITRKAESSTTEGVGLTFIDANPDGSRDTIQIMIANPKPLVSEVKEAPKEEKKFLEITSVDSSKFAAEVKPEMKQEPVITKTETKKEVAEPKKELPVEIKEEPKKETVVASRCAETAGEKDFKALRKNMAAADGDADMLAEATKYFQQKCFSTSQLRNLSSLFLSDALKYKFFDIAYEYVSDSRNFSGLQSELKEEYYINRFKAMLRN